MESPTRINAYSRSFAEYRLMFGLDDADRGRHILGVGDGASNFNAVATREGWRVRSVDPLYQLSERELGRYADATMDRMVDAVALVPGHWVWTLYRDAEMLRAERRRIAGEFLEDFSGNGRARYVAGALPHLPFADGEFDLALCSHLLFSWSTTLDLPFHQHAVAEMLRVAREVRISPTGKNLSARRSPFVAPLIAECRARGCEVSTSVIAGRATAANAERLVITRGRS